MMMMMMHSGFLGSRLFIDEYDFETSKICGGDDDESWKDLVTNSTAFSDTMVSPKPLKPPPRLQYTNEFDHSKSGGQSPAMSSPRTPTSVLKNLFSRKNLWNDDYDPFMVALENVKEEKRSGKWHQYSHVRPQPSSCIRPNMDSNDFSGHNYHGNHHSDPLHKRIGPCISLRYLSREMKPDEYLMDFNNNKQRSHESDPFYKRFSDSMRSNSFNKEMASSQAPAKDVPGSPKPKGAAFARHVRLVKMEHEKQGKQATTPLQKLLTEKEKTRNHDTSKRQKMKKFLKRSLSMTKLGDEHKLTQPLKCELLSQTVKSSDETGIGTKLSFAEHSPTGEYWIAAKSRLLSRIGHSARH